MNKSDHSRLSHMIEAAQDDRQPAFAVVRALEIVGEAASQISQELRDRYPNIKWQDIISMRNKQVHAHFDVDYNIVWAAVRDDIPRLVPELHKIIDENQ